MGNLMSSIENAESQTPRPRRLITSSMTLHKAVAVGGGLVCLGAILSPRKGFVERVAYEWPELVVKRVNDTYFYYSCSLALASIAGWLSYQSSTMMYYLTSCTGADKAKVFIISTTAVLTSGFLVKKLLYTEVFGAKQLTMLIYATTIGIIAAPVYLYGAQTLVEAAWVTAVINTQLTMASLLVPSRFALRLIVPITLGCIVVDIAHVGGTLLQPSTRLGVYARKVNLFGGILVYSGIILYVSHMTLVLSGTLIDTKGFDPISMCYLLFRATNHMFKRVTDLLTTEENSRSNSLR